MSRPEKHRAHPSPTVTTGAPDDTETEGAPVEATRVTAPTRPARAGYEYVTLKMALVGHQPGDEILIESAKVSRLKRLGVI